MSESILKIMVGPSAHAHQLKSGEIKFRKNAPAQPVWRLLATQEPENLLHTRFFTQTPTMQEIKETILGLLPEADWKDQNVVIPEVVEKLCPGLRETLACRDAVILVPRHGFAAGSRSGRHWEDFINNLDWQLNLVREAMASCGEISAASGHPLGVITLALDRRDEDRGFNVVSKRLAEEITRQRGRDPKAGFKQRMNESPNGQVNRGNHVAPPEDVLTTVLKKTEIDVGCVLTPRGETLRHLALALCDIRQAKIENQPNLLRELGKWIVSYHFEESRLGHVNILNNIIFEFPDEALRILISKAVKEALKGSVPVGEMALHGLAAHVAVEYPPECESLTLRGLPAHNHLETLLSERFSHAGQIVIDPYLQPVRKAYLYHPVLPDFSGLFNFGLISSRTPFNPANCFETITRHRPRKEEALLIAWALLPGNVRFLRALDDPKVTDAMTALVNDRLSRTGKLIHCAIGPWRVLGEILDIGEVEVELLKK